MPDELQWFFQVLQNTAAIQPNSAAQLLGKVAGNLPLPPRGIILPGCSRQRGGSWKRLWGQDQAGSALSQWHTPSQAFPSDIPAWLLLKQQGSFAWGSSFALEWGESSSGCVLWQCSAANAELGTANYSQKPEINPSCFFEYEPWLRQPHRQEFCHIIVKNNTGSSILHFTAMFDLHVTLGQSSLRGKGKGRKNGGRWDITAEFICRGRGVGPTGLWDYWLPGKCRAQGRTVFSWQSTPPAQMVGF